MYRKFTAENIFTGNKLLSSGNVLITKMDGTIVEIISIENAGEAIEQHKGILSPGFINAHCHLELSHLKGLIPEKTGLIDFILKVVFDRHFNEDIIQAAIEDGENELLQNGIVAVGDICNTSFTIPQKKKQRLQYHNFIETSGFPPFVAIARFQKSLELYQSYTKYFSSNAIVPHAPYSVSPALFQLIDGLPNNPILSIHNQETAAENELFKHKKGDFLRMFQKMNIDTDTFHPSRKSSLQTYLPLLTKAPSLLLVHNVFTNEQDIQFEKMLSAAFNRQTFYCICPNANLYISNVLPDIHLLMNEQCNIVLGTDSLASNHQLSIAEEIKTIQNNFPGISLETMLQWATINGARALQMDDTLGSFEKGKQPGVLLLECNDQILSGARRIL